MKSDNDFIEERISKLETTVTALSIIVIMIVVIGILLVIFK
jgi:hypothetical protein